jgi:hypothetical protein
MRVVADLYIEGDSEEDAKARFQHQLESESCSQLEDAAMWGEIFYYCIDKAGPYASDYEVVDVSEE